MWYFTVKQRELKTSQYRQLQKIASLTGVEIFNEPYENICVFEVKTERYQPAMDYLDLEGIRYDVSTQKPDRDQLLAQWS